MIKENKALQLLQMNPEFEGEESQQEESQISNLNNEEGFPPPPIGVAHPDLVESYMKTNDYSNEDEIKQTAKDLEDYSKETLFETFGRELKSHGVRAVEALSGSFNMLVRALAPEYSLGESLSGNKKPLEFPTASEAREITRKHTGKKYEPKSELSKNTQEATSDIAANLPFPGGWATKIVTPVLGQGVKALFKSQGADESTADNAKLAFLLTSTVAQIGNGPQMARNAYNEVMNQIPRGLRMRSNVLQRGLANIRNQPWYRTGNTTAKGPAFTEIDRLENLIQHGSLDVHDLLQARRDLGEARKRLGSYLYEPGMDKAQARRHIDEVDGVINDAINDFGGRHNPQWLNNYRRVNQAYAVTQRSRQIQDAVANSKAGKYLQSDMAKTLFHMGGASAISHGSGLLAAAVPVAVVAKGVQLMNRMWQSPLLRNYYAQVVQAATTQNMGALNKALEKFDSEAKKFEKDQNSLNAKSQM